MLDFIISKAYLAIQGIMGAVALIAALLTFLDLTNIEPIRYIVAITILVSGVVNIFNGYTNKLLQQALEKLSAENDRFSDNNRELSPEEIEEAQ